MNQELITGQTYQMNVTIGSGGTFSDTCFYVIAREEDCESCLTSTEITSSLFSI